MHGINVAQAKSLWEKLGLLSWTNEALDCHWISSTFNYSSGLLKISSTFKTSFVYLKIYKV